MSRQTIAACRRAHTLAAVVVVMFAAPLSAYAAGDIRIANVDSRAYPTIRLTVVTRGNSMHPPRLEEDGLPLAGLSVENMGRKKTLVMAIDRSRSMRGQPLLRAVRATRNLLATKRNSDSVSFVTFASRAVQLTSFSTSPTDADAALRSIAIDPHPGAKIYDAIVLAANALQHSQTTGRAIILVTDGLNTSSTATLGQAITTARRAHAAVYVVAIEDATFRPRPLRALAAKTGGQMLLAHTNHPSASIYSRIDTQLRDTWQMRYETAVRPGSHIHLTVNLPNTRGATTTVTLPEPASPAPSQPKLPLTLIGMFAFAMVPATLAAIAATRKFQRRNVWTGF